jgi:hypothetical protein
VGAEAGPAWSRGRSHRDAVTGSMVWLARHIHHREDEAWYVLDGQMTFYVGDEVLTAGSGSFVYAPKGIPVPPAGLSVPGPEVLGPVAERYGIEVVGPPIRQTAAGPGTA